MIILLIILITTVISIIAFNDREIFEKLKFNAFDIKHNRQPHRFFTYAFLHIDLMHLLVNMYVLWTFGEIVFANFQIYFGFKAVIYFLALYIGGVLFSALFDFSKHKNNVSYNAVGASGAVASIVFASIILHPEGRIFLFFIPIGIPSAIFGLLYLIYSAYMAKKANDNIGHNAHFWGSIFGVIFTIILKPAFFTKFINEVFSFI
ncbi:MAG: rhomboid family intramembrane serine protease [Bacteroidetes bacterium]|nr:rhomboid family intramembrane serine protease [Bacteroidota bacterium]